MCYFHILHKMETENQLKIHLIYLFADENKYTDSHL